MFLGLLKNKKLFQQIIIITIILLVSFFTPKNLVFAQGGIPATNEPETMSTYTTYMRSGIAAAQNNPGSLRNFDDRLYEGDQYLQKHPEVTEAEKQAYQDARRQYLRSRQVAWETGKYVPPQTNTSNYATDEYAKIVTANRINAEKQELDDINNKLADPNLDPESRKRLEERKKELEKDIADNEQLNQMATQESQSNDEAQKKQISEDEGACWTWTGGINPGNCLLITLGWVGNLITYMFGSLLWISSKIFDISIFLSISSIKSWFDADFVKNVWIVIRDIANIFFVFILLYIAIGTIFELNNIGSPQKMVVNVIVIALLVNFSGFFVRTTVDVANVIAYEFYSNMSGGSGGVLKMSNLGTNFISKLDLAKYYVKPDGETSAPQIERLSFTGVILQTFGNILLILAASFVLLVASILFIIRSIVLLVVYIFSPIALTTYVVPGFKKIYDQWLNALIKQSLYAPAFLIPLYVVFTLLGGKDSSGKSTGITGLIASQGGVADGSLFLIMADILILGLMISCIFIAQKMGAIGVDTATNLANKASQAASRPISRYGGRLASRVGARAANSPVGKAISDSWTSGRLSRVRQSWDTGLLREARQTQVAQKVGQAIKNPLLTASAGLAAASAPLSKAMGVKGLGNILGDKNFTQQTEEKAKKLTDELRAKGTDEDKARFLEGLATSGKREEFNAVYKQLTVEEKRKIEAASRASTINPQVAQRMEEERKKLKGKQAQELGADQVKNIKYVKGATDKATAIEHLDQADFSGVYKGLTPKERLELEKQIATHADPALLAKLTSAQSSLNPSEVIAMTRTRESDNAFDRVNAAMSGAGGPGIIPADIKKISREQIIDMEPRILADSGVAQHLSIQQLNAIQNSSITDTERGLIRSAIEHEIRSYSVAGGAVPPELAKLGTYLSGPGLGF